MMRTNPAEARRQFRTVWDAEGGRPERVARRLGITRRTLDRMIFGDAELLAAVRAYRAKVARARLEGRLTQREIAEMKTRLGAMQGRTSLTGDGGLKDALLVAPASTSTVGMRSRLYKDTPRRVFVALRVSWRLLCEAASAKLLPVHYDATGEAFFVRGQVTRAIRKGAIEPLPPVRRKLKFPDDLLDVEEGRVFVAPAEGAAEVIE